MRKLGNETNLIIQPKTLIFITIITSIIVVAFSMSRYQSTFAEEDNGSVAMSILDIQASDILTLKMNPNSPNCSQEFNFEVSNENGDGEKNEVSLLYTIEIENVANLPLNFTIYKFNEETKEYEVINMTSNITEQFEMNVNEINNHKYKLKIDWKTNTENVAYDSYKYSKTMDYVKIIVNAIQKD